MTRYDDPETFGEGFSIRTRGGSRALLAREEHFRWQVAVGRSVMVDGLSYAAAARKFDVDPSTVRRFIARISPAFAERRTRERVGNPEHRRLSEKARKRRWHIEHRAARAAYGRWWRRMNAERKREQFRAWRASNRCRLNVAKLAYYYRNRERINRQRREARRLKRAA